MRDRKRHNFNDFVPRYTDTYTKEMDEEGLKILKWSMFDSPDSLGSGKRFMESDPETFYHYLMNLDYQT